MYKSYLDLGARLIGAAVVASVVALGSSGVALAGAHGGSGWHGDCLCSPHPTESVSPSPTPSPTLAPSPSPTPGDDSTGGSSDAGGNGDVAGAETVSPTPSASPQPPATGSGLPDTGPAAAMGGVAGAAGISYAAYAYLRSKRRVQGALKNHR
jgi:hypothetical protein